MKITKLLPFAALLTAILTCCQSPDGSGNEPVTANAGSCMAIEIPSAGPRTWIGPRGWAANSRVWQASQTVTKKKVGGYLVLRVKFLNGTKRARDLAVFYANDWTLRHGGAKIQFKHVTSGKSDIRVTFGSGGGGWSYVGNDCRLIPQNKPTMMLSPSADGRVERHEFGHAIGFKHEAQHPEAGIQWDKEKVYAYYAQFGWDRATVDHNVLNSGSSTNSTSSGYDPTSCMHYPVDPSHTLDGYSVGWNTEVSEKDLILARRLYP